MSWHYLQGQEVESWEGDCLDGAPSALSSLIPTPEASCLPDRRTDALTDFQSGTGKEAIEKVLRLLSSCQHCGKERSYGRFAIVSEPEVTIVSQRRVKP